MQRNKAATLERVLLSSVQEFAQKGFHLARVSDIAALARCSTETIYDVYVSKEGLFMAVVAHVFEHRLVDDAALDTLEAKLNTASDPIERAVTVLTNYTSLQVEETFLAILYQVLSAKTCVPTPAVLSLFSRRRRFQAWLESALEAGVKDGSMAVGDIVQACEVLCNATGVMLAATRQLFSPHIPLETPFETARKAVSAFCTQTGAERLTKLATIPFQGPLEA